MKLFWCQEFFFENFDFINECKNEFKDNNEKSSSLSRNRVSHKIDFKAIRPRNGYTDSVGVKVKPLVFYVFKKYILNFKKVSGEYF